MEFGVKVCDKLRVELGMMHKAYARQKGNFLEFSLYTYTRHFILIELIIWLCHSLYTYMIHFIARE